MPEPQGVCSPNNGITSDPRRGQTVRPRPGDTFVYEIAVEGKGGKWREANEDEEGEAITGNHGQSRRWRLGNLAANAKTPRVTTRTHLQEPLRTASTCDTTVWIETVAGLDCNCDRCTTAERPATCMAVVECSSTCSAVVHLSQGSSTCSAVVHLSQFSSTCSRPCDSYWSIVNEIL
jgi:hypothetical protein